MLSRIHIYIDSFSTHGTTPYSTPTPSPADSRWLFYLNGFLRRNSIGKKEKIWMRIDIENVVLAETEKEERCNGNTFDTFGMPKHLKIRDTKLKLNENLICIF